MAGLYESQRAMRAMRKAALQRGVIAVLDMGTAKIGCFILRFEGSGASEALMGSALWRGNPSFGWWARQLPNLAA